MTPYLNYCYCLTEATGIKIQSEKQLKESQGLQDNNTEG